MTLQRRLRLYNLALYVAAVVAVIMGILLIWGWVTQIGALLSLPSGFSAPFSLNDIGSLGLEWYILLVGPAMVVALREIHLRRMAAITGHEQAMLIAQPELAEGMLPKNLPITALWQTSRSRLVTGATVAWAGAGFFLLLGIGLGILGFSINGSGQAVAASVAWSIGALTELGAIFLIFLGFRGLRQDPYGIVADERGISQWTPRGDAPLLAWNDLRLFEVNGWLSNGLIYHVYDAQGRWARWVAPPPVSSIYEPVGMTRGEATAAAQALIWLVRTHCGLTLHTLQPHLSHKLVTSLARIHEQGVMKAILWTYSSLPLALLTSGVLVFHGFLFPVLNVLSAIHLALYMLVAMGKAARQWVECRNYWQSPDNWNMPAPVSAWPAMVGAVLLLGGAGLGAIATISAAFMNGDPSWVLGDVLMTLGMFAAAAVGGYLLWRAWRQWRGGRSQTSLAPDGQAAINGGETNR